MKFLRSSLGLLLAGASFAQGFEGPMLFLGLNFN